jgi:hypothetical protein
MAYISDPESFEDRILEQDTVTAGTNSKVTDSREKYQIEETLKPGPRADAKSHIFKQFAFAHSSYPAPKKFSI